MTDTYRALCAELVKAWDATADFDFNDFGHAAADIVTRARAALAQPEPAPTDDELLASVRHFYGDQTAADMGAEDDLCTARAVLARYGRPTPQPVSTSERLPEQEDCIFPSGECWWFDPHADGAWYIDSYQGNYTHWLPAIALPTPEAND
jgi:hypothetical protein